MAANPTVPMRADGSRGGGLALATKQFFAWWRAELLASMPPLWRERLMGGPQGSPIAICEDQLVGYAVKSGILTEASRVPLAGLDAAGQSLALQRLLGAQGGHMERLMLVLPASAFIRKVIELPAAAEESLNAVLGFELDRHTPFKSTQARFAARVVGRSRDNANIRVELVVVPRERLDAMVARVTQLGATVSAVVPDLQGANYWRELDLLDAVAARAAKMSQAAQMNLILGAVFLVLLAIALLLPIWQKREAAKSLLPRLNSVKAESEAVQRSRTAIEQIANDTNYVIGRKHAHVPVTLLVEDLARAFPDSTWVAVLEIKSNSKQRELVLTGETGSASKFVELLDQISYLRNPTFRSPLTKTPGQTTERFVIAAELKARPIPQGVEDTTAPAAAQPPQIVPSPGTVPIKSDAGSPQQTPPSAAPAPAAAPVNPPASNPASAPSGAPSATPQQPPVKGKS